LDDHEAVLNLFWLHFMPSEPVARLAGCCTRPGYRIQNLDWLLRSGTSQISEVFMPLVSEKHSSKDSHGWSGIIQNLFLTKLRRSVEG
jgi:hypothetical protein